MTEGSTGHLDALWQQTTKTDRLEGLLAYRRYHRVLRTFAEHYGFGIVPTVEVFAAVSPNNDYHGNLRSLASVLDAVNRGLGPDGNYTVSTYKSCARRAYTYATGEVSFLDTVRGEKIRAFRHNLLYPRTSKQVTVDGHMYAAWLGDSDMTMKEAALAFGRSTVRYQRVADAITRLARRYRMLPHQMQATLWIARKRISSNRYTVQQHMDHGKHDLSRILCRPEDYPPYTQKM